MYKRTTETKIIRVTHKVSFGEGTRVADLIDNLKKVPPSCYITELDGNDGDGIVEISFREDKEIP